MPGHESRVILEIRFKKFRMKSFCRMRLPERQTNQILSENDTRYVVVTHATRARAGLF